MRPDLAGVLALQHRAGNAAVRSLLADRWAPGGPHHGLRLDRLGPARALPVQRQVDGDITSMSIDPQWAAALTDDELHQQIQIVQNQLSVLADGDPARDGAEANARVLSAESTRRSQSTPTDGAAPHDVSGETMDSPADGNASSVPPIAAAGLGLPTTFGPGLDLPPGGFPVEPGPFPAIPGETPLNLGAPVEAAGGEATIGTEGVLTVGETAMGDGVLASTGGTALAEGTAITGAVAAEGPAIIGASTIAGGTEVVAVAGGTAEALVVAGGASTVPVLGWIVAGVIVGGVIIYLVTRDPPAQAPGGSGQSPVSAPGENGSGEAQLPGESSGQGVDAPGADHVGSVVAPGTVDDPMECAKLNIADQMHDHHIYPQTFREDFRRILIDVDEFTITIPGDQHIGSNGVHTVFDWNGQWQDFFDEVPYGPLTPEQAQMWQTKARALAIEMLNDAGMADLPIHPYGL